jgi:hypothetical protein
MMARNPADFWKLAVFALAYALLSISAAAAPRSIDDCETIKQADAYNNCLATFGPAAHTGRTTATPTAPPLPDEATAPAETQSRGARSRSRPSDRESGQRSHRASRRIPPWLAARQAEGRRRAAGAHRISRGVTVLSHKNGRVRTIIDIRHR